MEFYMLRCCEENATEWSIAAGQPSVPLTSESDWLEIGPLEAVGSNTIARACLLLLILVKGGRKMFCIGTHSS